MKRNRLSRPAHFAVSSSVNLFASLARLSAVATLFPNPLALLGSLFLCLAPAAASAQSVTFTGTQTTLPFSGLDRPDAVAVDSAGDIFITDSQALLVLELPVTATGYGPQTALPFSGLSDADGGPGGPALDSAGDVFISDQGNNRVLELPRTATGYGPQTTLPFSGLNRPDSVAADSAGDVFVVDLLDGLAAKLPKTGTGYGPQVTLPFTGIDYPYLQNIAADSDKNVYLPDFGLNRVLELPWTGTGYGTQVTLPFSSLDGPFGVAVDSGGDVFVTNAPGWPTTQPSASSSVVELPKTSTGYGPQVTLAFSGLTLPFGDAVDNDGDVFVVDSLNNRVVELQTISVNFGAVNVCPAPAPCSQTLTLNYNVNADVMLGTPKVLTAGEPDLDFTLASGSTCTGAFSAGATCTVNVTFAPLAPGPRNGTVQIVNDSSNLLATTPIYGSSIQRASQTIDFPTIEPQTALTPIDHLYATASSGLPVRFASNTPTVCTISGIRADFLTAGSCDIIATQAGNSEYFAAITGQTFLVHHSRQVITFDPIAPQPVNTVLTLTATTDSELPITYASTTPTVCTVSGSTASLLNSGTCTIQASQAGDATYFPSGPKTQSFTVE